MDNDFLRARLGERFQQDLRLAAHEMHIKKQLLGVRPDSGYDIWTKGNVGHELAVHDVQMQPVGTRRAGRARLPGPGG